MTTYVVSYYTLSTDTHITIMPGANYPVRISQMYFYNYFGFHTVDYYPSTTLTGGAAMTPFALRGGSPPSTATVKTDGTLGGGEGANLFTALVGSYTSNYPSPGSTYHPASTTFQAPFDVVLTPGAAIDVHGTGVSGASFTIVIYFEELRLQPST